MAKKQLPSPELLRKLLRYEPDTGKLFWRERPTTMFQPQANRPAAANAASWNTRYAETEAGYVGFDGYVHLKVNYQPLAAHRIAWAMHYGEWAKQSIDHIDQNPANNRIANLREVPHIENMRNQRFSKANKSGVQGVHRCHDKWRAQIGVAGKSYRLGRFETLEAAAAARKAAEIKFGFHANHGKKSMPAHDALTNPPHAGKGVEHG